jgi:acetoin utilization deacetylase AcuC-like enzyme
MWHDTRSAASFVPADGAYVEPDEHAENPSTKRRLRNLVEVSGLLEKLVPVHPRAATEEEVLRLHIPEYFEKIKTLSADNGGDAGELTPFGPGSYEIALLAAGGCMSAVDAVLDGYVDNAYALVRPQRSPASSGPARTSSSTSPAAPLAIQRARGGGGR